MSRDDGTAAGGPGGLLAMLHSHSLIRQPEVVTTRSIAWLCGRAADNPFAGIIGDAGVTGSEAGIWTAEVRAEDLTRTDLECHWDDEPRVVVEAKLDETLTAGQLQTYADDLARRTPGLPVLLAVLVPAHRKQEAADRLAEVTPSEMLQTVVWTFDQVLTALDQALPDGGDIEQLRAFVRAVAALDIPAFTHDDVSGRLDDLAKIVDRASSAAATGTGTWIGPGGRDSQYLWRRYLAPVPGSDMCIAVGVVSQPATDTGPLVRVRVHRGTPDYRATVDRLRAVNGDQVTVDPAGHAWLDLHVATGINGAGVQADLVAQIEQILAAARG